ncbi:cob(I)yrinic acid a,c-diamide adenosyltransferase [Rhodovulum sp. ES.010]|uniref:cob(I)yrinic acid a,c-diamide adenosyltransferase n=1 Tax=Rhodovulum sp. ES.010 TaxID=1882821 RepID=UPI0020C99083|nr:cob(I)yrinic acid a,c-diamide adenosyltransferase [Rhodovulum sp. ES.010]
MTRTGDAGKTGLSDGSRVDKDTPRMEAIGTIDELNSQIGFARSLIAGSEDMEDIRNMLVLAQHDLFDLGGALSLPGADLLTKAHIDRIEASAERLNAKLPALKEFILPGGSPAVGAFHVARTTCRRAERRLLSQLDCDPQPGAFGLAYLNRLSDLLFIMARTVGASDGSGEQYWEAGKSLA